MKLQTTYGSAFLGKSPPPTGAWIETSGLPILVGTYGVAPSHGGVD